MTGKVNYGLDAPGVIRNLLLATLLGFLAWPLGLAFELVLWSETPEPFRIVFPLLHIGPSIGLVCLLMAWWMLYYSFFGKLRMREALLDRLQWRGDEAVLDVGCGRGLLLIGAAKRLKTGKTTGIDLWQAEDLAGNSPKATLANALAECVADRVEVRTGDVRKLPFQADRFDTIVSNAALHNIYDSHERRNALREIARVLKPGGRLVIADIRHTAEYAQVLKASGIAEVTSESSATSILLKLFTFGNLYPGTVTGRKAGVPQAVLGDIST